MGLDVLGRHRTREDEGSRHAPFLRAGFDSGYLTLIPTEAHEPRVPPGPQNGRRCIDEQFKALVALKGPRVKNNRLAVFDPIPREQRGHVMTQPVGWLLRR